MRADRRDVAEVGTVDDEMDSGSMSDSGAGSGLGMGAGSSSSNSVSGSCSGSGSRDDETASAKRHAQFLIGMAAQLRNMHRQLSEEMEVALA